MVWPMVLWKRRTGCQKVRLIMPALRVAVMMAVIPIQMTVHLEIKRLGDVGRDVSPARHSFFETSRVRSLKAANHPICASPMPPDGTMMFLTMAVLKPVISRIVCLLECSA